MTQKHVVLFSVGSTVQKNFVNALQGTTGHVNKLGCALKMVTARLVTVCASTQPKPKNHSKKSKTKRGTFQPTPREKNRKTAFQKKRSTSQKKKNKLVSDALFDSIENSASSTQSALGRVGKLAEQFNLPPQFQSVVTGLSEGLEQVKEKTDSVQKVWGNVGDAFTSTKKGMAAFRTGLKSFKKSSKKSKGKKGGRKRNTKALIGGVKGGLGHVQSAMGSMKQVALKLDLPPKVQTTLDSVCKGIEKTHSAATFAGDAWQTMGQGIKGGSSFLRRSTAQFKTVTSRLALFNIQALTTTARTRALSAGGSIKTFGRTLFSLAGRVIPIAINGFRALSVAVLANPVGLAIAGIAAGAFLIIKYWKPLGAFFGKLFGGVWEKAKKLFGWIFPQFKLIGALWKKFRGFFGKKDKDNTEPEAKETKRPGDTIAKKSRPKSPRAPMPPGFQPSAVQRYSPKPQRPPLPIQRAGMATAPPKPSTMPPSNGQTTINVYPKEGQSEARIAEEVMRRMEQNRGRRLHD